MLSFFDAQLTHSRCYLEVLKQARGLYGMKGENMSKGLEIFDNAWSQIKHGRNWVYSISSSHEEADQLCYEYAYYSDQLMAMRGLSRERIEWLKSINIDEHPERLENFADLGVEYRNIGEYDNAIKIFTFVLYQYRHGRDPASRRYQAGLFMEMGICHKNNLDLEAAKECYDDAAKLYKQIGEYPYLPLLVNQGNLFDMWGKSNRAKYYFNRAIKLAQKKGDTIQEAITLLNLAGSMLSYSNDIQGDRLKIEEYSKKAYELLNLLGDYVGAAKSLSVLANLFSRLNDVDQSIEYCHQALELYDRHTIVLPEKHQTLLLLRDLTVKKGYLTETADVAKSMEIMALELEDPAGQANSLLDQGWVFQDQHKFHEARKCFMGALPIFHQIGNLKGEAQTISNLGLTYIEDDLDQAILHYQQSLEISNQYGFDSVKVNTLANLGNAYLFKEQIEEAEKYHQDALLLAEEIEDLKQIITVRCYQGMLCAHKGFLDEAVSIFQEVLSNPYEAAGYYIASFAHLYLGQVYDELENQKSALEEYLKAQELFTRTGNNVLLERVENLIRNMGK